jgi:hypothetical protein
VRLLGFVLTGGNPCHLKRGEEAVCLGVVEQPLRVCNEIT